MKLTIRTASLLALLLSSMAVQAQDGKANKQGLILPGEKADYRFMVEMSPKAQSMLRQDMLQMLTGLAEAMALVGAGRLDEAADVAEQKLGPQMMAKYKGVDDTPPTYMPAEMRSLGMKVHGQAMDFANIARKGNTAAAISALADVASGCTRCHWGYRIQ